MERRSSLRKPIHLDAIVRLEGGAKWPCIVADYCDQGMFLKFSMVLPNPKLFICFHPELRVHLIVFLHPSFLLELQDPVHLFQPHSL